MVRLLFFQYLYYKNNLQNDNIPDQRDVFNDKVQTLEDGFNTLV
jgi:hypothetical protein